MKRIVLSFAFASVGLLVGGALMFYYMRPQPGALPFKKGVDHGKPGKKVLFYRSPMNPNVLSPTPMKDDMGMDYIPVYEGEGLTKAQGEGPSAIRIGPEKIQRIGVKSEATARRTLKRVIRTIGRVEPVENLVYNINTKVPGWVERLYVSRTDQMVHPGEPLLELYSPDLVTAQEEYLLAWKSLEKGRLSSSAEVRKNAETLLEASKRRLKSWDITDDQIKGLTEAGKTSRTMIIRAPAHGSVTEKMVVAGQKIEAGETLFKIIDHSRVWVYGEIYENEMPYVKVGDEAVLRPSYTQNESYRGRIEHIYSHLGSIKYEQGKETEVRSAKIRFELPNEKGRLRLGVYLNIELPVTVGVNVLSVPESAVIDSGRAQMVIIDLRDGSFKPRSVVVGARSDGYYEIRKGINEGEWVVTSANFLIDSESNLKAALGAMGGHEHGEPPDPKPRPGQSVAPEAQGQGHSH